MGCDLIRSIASLALINPIVTLFPRPPRWLILTAGALTQAFAFLAGDVRGADETGQIWGRWQFVKERSAQLDTVTESAAKDLPFFLRPLARTRLLSAIKPYQWVQLGRTGDQIQIATSDWPAICTDGSGSKILWSRPDGKKQQVSTSLSGETLTQVFSGSEGTYTNVYSRTADGLLLVRVTLTSPMMKAPVSWVLRYRPQSG